MAWYDNIPGLSQMALPVTIERGKPAPLDKYSLFDTYEDALDFVTNHDAAYEGAFIYIKTTEASTGNTLGGYVVTGIKENAAINKLAATSASGDIEADVIALQTEVTKLLADADTAGSVDNKVKVAIDALKTAVDASLGAIVTKNTAQDASIAANATAIAANASAISANKTAVDASLGAIVTKNTAQDASITALESAVENVAVYDLQPVSNPGAQWAAQYKFTKDGADVTTINIPKDQFLKEATFVSSAEQADKDVDSSVIIGDPYLKFIWQLENEGGPSTTYVPVKQLVDTYTGSTYISVTPTAEGKQISLNYSALLAQVKSDVVTNIDASLAAIVTKNTTQDASIAANASAISGIVTKNTTQDASIAANASAIASNKTAVDASLAAIVTKNTTQDASIAANASAIASNKTAVDASIAAVIARVDKVEVASVNGKAFSKDASGNISVEVNAGDITVGKAIADLGTQAETTVDAAIEAVVAKIGAVNTGVMSVTAKDSTVTVDNSDTKNPKVGLAISAQADNILETKADGVYASIQWGTIA